MFGQNRSRLTFEDWALKTIFHFTKPFLTRHIVSPPQANIYGKDSFRVPKHSFFSDLPFSKFGTEGCPPVKRGRGTDIVHMLPKLQWFFPDLIVPFHYNWTNLIAIYPANIYLFKVNNRNNKNRCEICSTLTIKNKSRWRRYGIYY